MNLKGKRVFVSGPYSSNPDHCVAVAIRCGDLLIEHGAIPFIPHLYHFAHAIRPRPYETWIEIDLAWLECCDALVRLSGKSPGADREVAWARELGIPVLVPSFLILHDGMEMFDGFVPMPS